jgi:hypothetical protein
VFTPAFYTMIHRRRHEQSVNSPHSMEVHHA